MKQENTLRPGLGVYSVKEAERLTGVPAPRIRRWVRGYAWESRGRLGSSSPVWRPDYPQVEGKVALSFRDLIEVRFVDAFLRHGVTWPVIRVSAENAAAWLNESHPFSTRRFQTNGRRIFAQAIEEVGTPDLLELASRQRAFLQILAPALYAGLEFSEADVPLRWRPMPGARRVVIDPRRAFGRPVVDPESVPTEVLAKAFAVEKSVDRVARWFEVDPRSVKDAIEFERRSAA